MQIKLDNEAKIALKEAYNYIKKDSLQNEEKVRNRRLESIKELIKTLISMQLISTDKTRISLIVCLKYISTGSRIMYLLMKSGLSG